MDACKVLWEIPEPIETHIAVVFVADVTLMVIVPILMLDLVAFGWETLVAEIALVRLLACMYPRMHLKIRELLELHATDFDPVDIKIVAQLLVHFTDQLALSLSIFISNWTQNAHMLGPVETEKLIRFNYSTDL